MRFLIICMVYLVRENTICYDVYDNITKPGRLFGARGLKWTSLSQTSNNHENIFL